MAKINGTSGNDRLVGTILADALDGLADNDTLTGGAGIDTLLITAGTDTLTELGTGGADVLVVSAGAAVNATMAIAVSLTGSVKADSLFGPVCSAAGCGAAR